MHILRGAELASASGARVELRLDHGHCLMIDGGAHVVRVLLQPAGGLATPRSWSLAPDVSGPDEPLAGRDRGVAPAFAQEAIEVAEDAATITLSARFWRAVVTRSPLAIAWSARASEAADFVPVLSDRPTAAYRLPRHGSGFRHALVRDKAEHYYGLGEKTGNTNRHGRRFEMGTTDALGYDAETSDPLYKHIPWYVTVRPDLDGRSVGIFYDALAHGRFDFGREIDAYHGNYRSFEVDHGDLDYYVVFGPGLIDVTRRFTALTGRTAFGPRWAIPYSGSTMQYTDDANPPARFEEFLGLLDQHGISSSSFHLSSGYTMIGDKRYVFNWNHDKFPDPKAFSARLAQAGIRIIANIKPALLVDHPRFAEVEAFRGFVRDADDPSRPHLTQFWGADGAYIDFTNPKASDWWSARVTDQLLDMGIVATWNDNNEFEIWDDEAPVDLDGRGGTIAALRPVQTHLMMRASARAQVARSPDKRPFLVSRSGGPGMQRFVQTWSGDNRTDWKTLRYNLRMGHGMTLSGLYNFGHDIGGFEGPKPGPELFLRWVEQGIFWPRFSIHSWNDDGSANEPWMYPEILPQIVAALEWRERLVPYLYTLLWRAHAAHEPVISPLFLQFPNDPATYAETDSFLLGDALLVAPILDEGATSRSVYLPDVPGGWYDFWTGAARAGGRTVMVDAVPGRCPAFMRAGTILPLGPTRSEGPGDLTCRIYPGPQGAFFTLFDDDGESVVSTGSIALVDIRIDATGTASLSRAGGHVPRWGSIRFETAAGAPAAVRLADGRTVTALASADIAATGLPSVPLADAL